MERKCIGITIDVDFDYAFFMFLSVLFQNDIYHIIFFRTFSPKYGIKANVWAVRYNQAKGPKLWRLVVPRNAERYPRDFENFIDRQTGEDSGFFIRNNKLWTRFVQHQEERLRTPGNRVKFILAECTGLQVDAMTWGPSRDTERYVFDHHSIFDHTGAKLSPVDCVFYPSLSVRKDSLPILKGIR